MRKKMIKRKNSTVLMISAVLSSVLLSGCLSFSTKPRGLQSEAYDMKGRSYDIVGMSEGQSSSFKLLWLFPVTPGYDYKEAVDEAIALKEGDNLIEVEHYFERQWWIVGTIEVVTVRGKVIKYQE